MYLTILSVLCRALKQNKELKTKTEELEERFITMVWIFQLEIVFDEPNVLWSNTIHASTKNIILYLDLCPFTRR